MPRPVYLPSGDALVDALVAYRREAAKKLGAPVWRVLPNATLVEIAIERPATREALRRIPGMGPERMKRHARRVLALVEASR
ncbi:MAG: HRDC domain-containing protein [Thermoplasmatota archaeon]